MSGTDARSGRGAAPTAGAPGGRPAECPPAQDAPPVLLRGEAAVRRSHGRFALAALSALGAAATAVPAWPHVTVTPAQSAPAATQRYCVRVPGEKPVPTTRVEVQFPGGLQVTGVEAPQAWAATTQKDRDGRIVGAIWEGGRIVQKEYLEFGVLARNPDTAATLAWKAIQTYRDGSEVHWIGPPRAQFPAAVTAVSTGGTGPGASGACTGGRADSAR